LAPKFVVFRTVVAITVAAAAGGENKDETFFGALLVFDG
jgi:hypothetical protein